MIRDKYSFHVSDINTSRKIIYGRLLNYVFVSLGSLIFCFSKYGKGTEKVWNWGRVRVRKKYKKFQCGYGNGYGKLSNMGTEKREGYGLF